MVGSRPDIGSRTMCERTVFIVGSGRSGSTLLDMVLGANSRVLSTGELIHFPLYVRKNGQCSCRNPIRQCKLWGPVIERFCGSSDHLPQAESIERIAFSADLEDKYETAKHLLSCLRVVLSNRMSLKFRAREQERIRRLQRVQEQQIDNYWKLIVELHNHSNRTVVLDSSKSALRAIALCGNLPTDSFRIIHLVRDGRAVVHSYMKHQSYMEKHIQDSSGVKKVNIRYNTNAKSAQQAVRIWLSENLRASMIRQYFPKETTLLLRYEDFVNDPEFHAKRVCRFIGISYEPDMLQFRHAVHHNLGGNAMRFRSDNIHPPEKTWRWAMKRRDRALFALTAGWLNSHFGYTCT